MNFIFNNFWIFFILVTIINAISLKHRSREYIAENPNLEEGYNKFFRGILIFGNIPWLIMAIGNISQLTDSIFQYFYPRSLNPIVLIFHLSIIYLYVHGSIWIYLKNGAEFIANHPGLMNPQNVTAKQVKIFYPLILAGGIIAFVVMWMQEIPQL